MAEPIINNSKLVTVSWGGFLIADGRAEGTYMNIEPVGDVVATSSGANGDFALSVTNDFRHDVTLTFQYGSVGWETVLGVHNGNVDLPGGGSGPGASAVFVVADIGAKVSHTSTCAVILTSPTYTYSSGTVEAVEWVFQTGDFTTARIPLL